VAVRSVELNASRINCARDESRRVCGVTTERDKCSIAAMLEIFFIVVIVGVIAIDHRLHKLVKIQREQILKDLQLVNGSQREIVKALQWIVDNWKH
jgi:hypothetical protein